jgi:hypothetical protein
MLEIIVIIALIILLGIVIIVNIQERERLVKMILAKNLTEYTNNEALDKIPKQTPFKPSDEVSMDDAIEDDKLFDLHLAAVKKQAQEEFDKVQS